MSCRGRPFLHCLVGFMISLRPVSRPPWWRDVVLVVTVKAPRIMLLIAALASSTACASARARKSSREACRDYKPMCVVGNKQCTVDKRGCTVCTCVRGSPSPLGPYQPWSG